MVLTYFLVGRSVNDGNQNAATYSHLANSPLVGQIVYANNGATRMTTTKQYDDLNRLTQISSVPGGTGLLPLTYAYNYNAANQRTRNTFPDGSHWVDQYDALGQVTHGGRYWNDGRPGYFVLRLDRHTIGTHQDPFTPSGGAELLSRLQI